MKENNNNQTNPTKNCQKNYLFKKSSSCKSRYSSRVFVLAILTLLSICGATLAHDIGKNKNGDDIFKVSEGFHRNLYQTTEEQHKQAFAMFGDDDIFKEMTQMQKNMDTMFENHHKRIVKMIDEAKKNSLKNGAKNTANAQRTSVISREDKDNYYYDLSFFGFKKEDISVAIKDNNLSFSLQKNQNNDTKDQKLQSSSSFYYSFSVPEHNNKIEPEIIKQDDKIVVKFVKKNSGKV